MYHLLVADIGGTHARFSYFSLKDGMLEQHGYYEQPTARLQSTEDALRMAANTGLHPNDADKMLWGVAGLIDNEGLSATLTNGSLTFDFHEWRHKGIFVNDFILQAWATIALPIQYTHDINKRVPAPCTGTKCVVGAGTGLGVGTLAFTGTQYCREIHHNDWVVLASESGHVDLSFTNDESDFVSFAQHTLCKERLSAEDILAARGLSLIYEYVHGQKVSPKEAAWSFQHAQGNNKKVLTMYARFLGRLCRHIALHTLCTGGIYLSGSVLSLNPAISACDTFLDEFFTVPSTMLPLISRIPITRITHPQPGLWGAAFAAKRMIEISA